MRKVLLGVLFVIITSAAFFFLVYQPKTIEIEDAETELQTLETETAQLRARVASLRRIEDRLVEYRDAVNQMAVSVPGDPEMDVLIVELNQLAVDSGVEWLSGAWSVPAEPDPQGLRAVPVNISVEGQYFEVLGYLYGISEMDRLIVVDSLAFSPTLQDDGFNVISVNISAFTFTTGTIQVPELPEEETAADETTTTTTTPGNNDGFGGSTTTTIPATTTTTAGG